MLNMNADEAYQLGIEAALNLPNVGEVLATVSPDVRARDPWFFQGMQEQHNQLCRSQA